jgi:hypothetical protein
MAIKKKPLLKRKETLQRLFLKSNTSGIYPIGLYMSRLKTLPGKGLGHSKTHSTGTRFV